VRIAAIYDIHGNLPALEAVLGEVRAAGAGLVVVGGDVAAGPLPRETIERLAELPAPARFVRGNADRMLVECYDGMPLSPRLPPHVREVMEWAAGRLDRAHRDFLAGFEETVDAEADGVGGVLFCHGSPRSDEEIITEATPDERVRAMVAGVSRRVVVCGHTHMQFDRVVDGVRVVNAGSVGMPFGEPGAYWALLGPGVELRRTDYDLRHAADLIRASAYPQAADFADNNVLHPPSAAEALALFEGAASNNA
jgi:putative phosphoesterase